MSNPLKPSVAIAISVVSVLILVAIGFKMLGSQSAPERTDDAHRKTVESYAARSAKPAGQNGTPAQQPPH